MTKIVLPKSTKRIILSFTGKIENEFNADIVEDRSMYFVVVNDKSKKLKNKNVFKSTDYKLATDYFMKIIAHYINSNK